MTYNLMRVVEGVSKAQNPDLIHPSDKKYTQTLEKRQQAARKKGRFVNPLFFQARIVRISSYTIRAFQKRGRPKKGEERIKEPTGLEKQSTGMSLAEMKADLPTACNIGTKCNSRGYKTSWNGYKLHIDAADGGLPVSCLLSSASLHDSQAAIPLAEMTQHG